MNCLLQEIPSFVHNMCVVRFSHLCEGVLDICNTRLQNYFCSVPLLMNWVEAERYLVSDQATPNLATNHFDSDDNDEGDGDDDAKENVTL